MMRAIVRGGPTVGTLDLIMMIDGILIHAFGVGLPAACFASGRK